MSLSQSMPPNYQSLLYPNTNGVTPQQTILPKELTHGTGGNAVDYMSKAVGGRRRHKKTIIRSVNCPRCSKSYKCHRHKCGGKTRKTRKNRKTRKGK